MRMKEHKNVGRDLTEGNILALLTGFTVPIFLSNFIQQLYNIVDVIVIGQMAGSAGTVSVSTGGEIVNLLIFVGNGLSSATQVYISQLAGKKDKRGISETIGTVICFMTVLSVLMAAFCIAFCRPLLFCMNTPAEAFSQAADYMVITAIGLPFIFGYNAICGVLRGMGESGRPLLFVLLSAVVNIFLDLFFVVGLHMAAAGTAWATVIAQITAFLASFFFLYRKKEQLEFSFAQADFKIRKEHLNVLLQIGIPMALSSIFIHFSQIYCNARINRYGLVASAVNSVGNKIVRFTNIFSGSVNTAAAAMIGQNIGAGRRDRVRSVVSCSLGLGMIFAAANIILCFAAPRSFFRLFSSDAEVIEAGVTFMHISVITFLLSAWQGPYMGVVTGTGNSRFHFLVGLLDGVILRISISLMLADLAGMGVTGYFYGNALARLAPCMLCTWYFFSGEWEKQKKLGK